MNAQKDIIVVLGFWVIYNLLIAWFLAGWSRWLLTSLIVGLILTAIYLFIRILSSLKGKKPEIPKGEIGEPENKPEPKQEQNWNPAIIENFENVFKPDFGIIDLD